MIPPAADITTPVLDVRRAYALAFVRDVLGTRDIRLEPTFADEIAAALARDEELSSSERDEWDNWDFQFSVHAKRGMPSEPWLDERILGGGGVLQSAPSGNAPLPRWPSMARFAICITHDVDGVTSRGQGTKFLRRAVRVLSAEGPRHIPARLALGSLFRLVSDIGTPDRIGQFERYLEIEARHGFRSTWFFLPSAYAKAHAYDLEYRYGDRVIFDGASMTVKGMMRAIDARGCEVGLHGSYLSHADAEMLHDQRTQVERAVGKPVRSIRQHYLRYDPRRTPAAQSASGFFCDSSQGFNTAVGFRAGTCFPYWAWDASAQRPSSVLEIPMLVMDGALFDASTVSCDDACRKAIEIMDAVERVGGCLTLNWHPNRMAEPLFLETFEVILREAAARSPWSCTAAQMYDWWTRRWTTFESETATQ